MRALPDRAGRGGWSQGQQVIVDYPDSAADYPVQRRVGGYYQSLEEIETAADLLAFDVLVPPKARHGFYMVPASTDDATAAEVSRTLE